MASPLSIDTAGNQRVHGAYEGEVVDVLLGPKPSSLIVDADVREGGVDTAETLRPLAMSPKYSKSVMVLLIVFSDSSPLTVEALVKKASI
jgi:hypothetical protein